MSELKVRIHFILTRSYPGVGSQHSQTRPSGCGKANDYLSRAHSCDTKIRKVSASFIFSFRPPPYIQHVPLPP